MVETTTHHPTRSRDPNASQPFFPRRKRANSGAPRWCMAANPTVEMSRVGRWPGRCSGRMAAIVRVLCTPCTVTVDRGFPKEV